MYTAHTKFGIGEMIEETENAFIVFYEDVNKTCTLIKAIPTTFYATYEEAEAVLEAKEAAKEQEVADMRNVDLSASNWLAEKNRENALNNLPSSLR